MQPTWLLVFVCGAFTAAPRAFADEPQTGPGTQAPVTPEEIAKLKRQIQQDTRSSLELSFDTHSETGDLNNRLDLRRYGARLNVRVRRATMRLSAARTSYATIDDLLDETGTNVTLGLSGSLSPRIDGHVDVGVTHFTTDATTVNFRGSVSLKPTEKVRYSLTVERSSVEESLLSAAGMRPVTGPFAGELVGAVMENRVLASASYRLPAQFDVFGEAAAGTRVGSSVDSNFFKRAGGGVGYNAVARGEDQPLSLFRLSASLYYFGFADDRFGFGGASLLDRRYEPVSLARLGSDGLPTDPSGRSPGVGGYFSPSRFVSRLAHVDVRGRPRPSFEYRLEVFAGSQTYTGFDTRGAKGVRANVVLHGGDRVSLPVTFVWDDVGPFRQRTLFVKLLARF
jgi:hypothetical protein